MDTVIRRTVRCLNLVRDSSAHDEIVEEDSVGTKAVNDNLLRGTRRRFLLDDLREQEESVAQAMKSLFRNLDLNRKETSSALSHERIVVYFPGRAQHCVCYSLLVILHE